MESESFMVRAVVSWLAKEVVPEKRWLVINDNTA